MRRVFFVPIGEVFLGGCRAEEPTSGQDGNSRPNVTLIGIELVRTRHAGGYGHETATTPSMDALSREAVTFDHACSVTGWTLTSHASIFTGPYRAAPQVLNSRDRLSDASVTLSAHADEKVLEPAGAIRRAEQAAQLTSHREAAMLDTVAAVQAAGTVWRSISMSCA
jgi:hypothetical protein